MKLSTNFLKEYVNIDVPSKQLAEDMTNIGNEYDSVKKIIDATNLIIGEVKECEKHPDSDHLHVCKVDVGTEVLDIVCGAPNVRKGLKVIVALPGAELPGGVTIKKGIIRGAISNGMMCSMAELGLENKFLSKEDKEGIHELEADAPVGKEPIEYLGLNDEVIDFELTANRGDLLSILGMAYEVGAIYNKKVEPINLEYKSKLENIENNFKVEVNTENCSIFLAKKTVNVTIKESPKFIKNRLIASGIRPINNVVDISNYVMLETGQPLHFYDADKLGEKIVVRMANEDEKLVTLDNIERTLSNEDIVITDGEKAIGLAGVMGGLDTEIELNTKNILIESAIFNPIKIRYTSNKILRSEASIRFEKGLDSNRTYMAIERACSLLQKYADAEIVSGIVKYDTTNREDKKIDITFENINNLLGLEIPHEEILNVFEKLGFTSSVSDNVISVMVPKRRIDISIKEDLIEEVGRIYGVNNIVGKLPVIPVKPGSYNKTLRDIRNKMVALGLNEVLTYALINEKEVHNFTTDEFETLKLLSPLSEDRNSLRYSMIPSLLKIYEYNNARNIKDVCIFEIGKGFYKKENYGEDLKLCALLTGDYYLDIENKKKVDFYVLKGIVEELLDYLGYGSRYSFVVKDLPKEFHPGQSAVISVNNMPVGIMGKLHPELTKEDIFVLEINLDKLLDKKVSNMKYKEISKFPSIQKDLAVLVDKNISAQEIATNIKRAAGSLLTNIELFDYYKGENIEKTKKSLAYSLTFEDANKTLTDEEVSKVMENVVTNLEKKLGAELRN